MVKSYAIGLYFEDLKYCEVKIILALNPKMAMQRAMNITEENLDITIEEFQEQVYDEYKIIMSQPVLVRMF